MLKGKGTSMIPDDWVWVGVIGLGAWLIVYMCTRPTEEEEMMK
jgi:hypothetical protein